jgi:CarboxypepD_reg-like domain
MYSRVIVGPLVSVLLPVSASVAQPTTTIVAGVADAATGAPLVDAQVRVPELGRIGRTNWIGEARIAGVPEGKIRLEVRKLGYAPSDITLPVKGDSVGAVFMLERTTQQLDTVTVMGRIVPRRLKDFEIRRQFGIGKFVTDSVLEKEASRPLSDILTMRFPGIRVGVGSSGVTSMRFSTSVSKGADYCKVDVYLDNMLYLDNLDDLHAWEIAGAEFYTIETAPPQYRRGTGSCQVIVLWSKY